MELLIALAHIGGAVLAIFVLGFFSIMILSWELERNKKRALEEAALALGVTVNDLEEEGITAQLIKYTSERFSNELFRNRISDLCGFLRTAWGWLGTALQLAVLVGVVWYTFTDDMGTAVNAWWLVGISLFFYITSIAFSLVCRFLTGRYPGQARQVRKGLGELLKNQRTFRPQRLTQSQRDSS